MTKLVFDEVYFQNLFGNIITSHFILASFWSLRVKLATQSSVCGSKIKKSLRHTWTKSKQFHGNLIEVGEKAELLMICVCIHVHKEYTWALRPRVFKVIYVPLPLVSVPDTARVSYQHYSPTGISTGLTNLERGFQHCKKLLYSNA